MYLILNLHTSSPIKYTLGSAAISSSRAEFKASLNVIYDPKKKIQHTYNKLEGKTSLKSMCSKSTEEL